MNFQYETERLNIRILSSDFAGKTLEFHKNNRSTFEKYDGEKPENFYTLPKEPPSVRISDDAAAKSNPFLAF